MMLVVMFRLENIHCHRVFCVGASVSVAVCHDVKHRCGEGVNIYLQFGKGVTRW